MATSRGHKGFQSQLWLQQAAYGQCSKNPQEMGVHDASPSQPRFQTSADLERPFPTSPLTLPNPSNHASFTPGPQTPSVPGRGGRPDALERGRQLRKGDGTQVRTPVLPNVSEGQEPFSQPQTPHVSRASTRHCLAAADTEGSDVWSTAPYSTFLLCAQTPK